MSYTKLFKSIVTSSLWAEDAETKVVWITMLALADQNGEVQASIPGLARTAGVPLEACERALGKFLSPDKYSRTKTADGRRIEAIDGGWELITHAKHRNMASKIDAQAKHAARQQRYRERHATVTERHATVTERHAPSRVTHSDATVTQGGDIAEAEAEADKEKKRTATDFSKEEEIYKAYPLKVNKPAALKAIRRALEDKDHAVLLAATIDYAKARPAGTPFTKHPATWFNGRCFEDDPSSWRDPVQAGSVTGAPPQGSLEFCPGWRNKPDSQMTSKERVAYCE